MSQSIFFKTYISINTLNNQWETMHRIHDDCEIPENLCTYALVDNLR
jgi:hypothetical protein